MASSRTQVSPAPCSTWRIPTPRPRKPPTAPADSACGSQADGSQADGAQGDGSQADGAQVLAEGSQVLAGGTANRGRVVRVGDTVVRPAPPCRPATHALLAHLRAAGFDGAPRVLASGPDTETLTYIHGAAAIPPLRPELLTDDALVSVADLLRRYHRAVASFDPAGFRWPRPIPAAFRTGVVSHNDVYPANLVFRDGRAAALIDFDLAGPGSPAWDFASAARSWVPLAADRDVPDSLRGRTLDRFRVFLEASGLTRDERRVVAEAIVANHDWTYAIVTEAAAAGHPAFAEEWRAVAAPAGRARLWYVRYRRDLVAAAT